MNATLIFYWCAIAVGALALLIGALLLYRALVRAKLRKIGKDGERMVSKVLRKYAGIRSYKVMNDIYIPLYDGATQIDHILIGFFGVLVIETKNYRGDIYADPKAKQWTQVVGEKKNNFYNPIMQNQTHVDALRYLLNQNKMYKMQIDSLVVFTGANRKSNLYIQKGNPVITLKQLKGYLRKSRYSVDNNVDVDEVYKLIKANEVTDKSIIREHDKEVSKKSR